MEIFSALLALCAVNSPVNGEFPSQRPVTRSFDVFFHLCLNKRLSKLWWGWWFGMLSGPLWRNRNGLMWILSISAVDIALINQNAELRLYGQIKAFYISIYTYKTYTCPPKVYQVCPKVKKLYLTYGHRRIKSVGVQFISTIMNMYFCMFYHLSKLTRNRYSKAMLATPVYFVWSIALLSDVRNQGMERFNCSGPAQQGTWGWPRSVHRATCPIGFHTCHYCVVCLHPHVCAPCLQIMKIIMWTD